MLPIHLGVVISSNKGHLEFTYEASLFDKNYVAFGMSQIRAQRCVVGNMI